jgi:hypothetical protein
MVLVIVVNVFGGRQILAFLVPRRVAAARLVVSARQVNRWKRQNGARDDPTIRRLKTSRRHQLSPIAPHQNEQAIL